ncbi:hypothetical protein [Mesorhizobium sp. B1-1-8]|uniref:hypothetical protein n=1 Tax=Mesorhizobium sp. B1-1-8 TaxID=2589976 RepID=UPI00112ECD0D|nr:hypothetical protein [Mesorhizobium sp. B1-1-8]UCI09481.1 hypothetical protein FJ974_10665 [Mesorhizobium sp. B1-1-8]
MASINDRYIQIASHYETAISIQDRLIEGRRRLGLSIEKDEALLQQLREGLDGCIVPLKGPALSFRVR